MLQELKLVSSFKNFHLGMWKIWWDFRFKISRIASRMIHTIYCLIASILFWNSFLAAFMFAIIAPMLPTMEAKMSTPTRKSMVTKAYLGEFGGVRNSEHYEMILLQVVHRLRCLSNCCQRQGGPIEAVDVLSDQSRIALNDVLQNFLLVPAAPGTPTCLCWTRWQSWWRRRHKRSSGWGWGCKGQPLWS